MPTSQHQQLSDSFNCTLIHNTTHKSIHTATENQVMPHFTCSPVPKLQDYDISHITGFLPSEGPLRRLTNPYFTPWEDIVQDLPSLLLCGKLREKILKLEILDTSSLTDLRELQRAFVVLCFLAHSFIWGKNEPVLQTLPPCVAIPLIKVSSILDINPVGCNASQVVWNWRLIDSEEPVSLGNLSSINTFTGSMDEAWFYLITVAIEAHGGDALSAMVDGINSVREGDEKKVLECLSRISYSISKINLDLHRMYEKCDPYLFYWKIRPYLAGWENMAEAGLPFGVQYQGVDEEKQFRQYAGGSAGQSALIQAFDIALGIVHYPTTEEWKKIKKESKLNPNVKMGHANYLFGMRSHMPGLHRRFLEDLTKVANIRQFVEEREGECREKYNECISGLKRFRDIHIQIVTRYIVLPARKGPTLGSFSIGVNTNSNSENSISESFLLNNNGTRPKPPYLDLSSNSNSTSGPGSQSISAEPILLGTPSTINPKTSPRLVAADPKSPGGDYLYPQLLHNEKPIASPNTSHFANHGIAKTITDPVNDIVRGTGGTVLMPFLKQVRDETSDCLILPP